MNKRENDLISALITRLNDEDDQRRGQLQQLADSLGSVTGEEARQLYRYANEQYELPETGVEELVESPLLLFGPAFVIDAIQGIRDGSKEVPIKEWVVEPIDE